MALRDIITKIGTDAESEAEAIRAKAREEADAILGTARDAAEKRAHAASTANRAVADAAAGRITSAAAHSARLTREGKRAEIIGRVFAESEAMLAALPEKEYAAFVTEKAKGLADEKGTLTVSKEREEETVKALKAAGLSTSHVEVAPKGTLIGGFVLETKTAVYDYSFSALVKQARETKAAALSQTLFGQAA